MPYRGHIKNGVVVLDVPVPFPEGSEVSVDAAPPTSSAAAPHSPLWGLFADEPELIDQILADTMKDREKRRLRDVDV